MTVTTMRDELKECIDSMPYGILVCVKPILFLLAAGDTSTRFVRDGYTIESDLTEEETAVIKAGLQERAEHPENYTEWKPHSTYKI